MNNLNVESSLDLIPYSQQLLADFLNVDCKEITASEHGVRTYEVGDEEYLVLTDDEAECFASDYIKDSLWAFNPSFIATLTGLPEVIYEALQPQCEDANEAVLKLVEMTCTLEHFVGVAIGADGRGHFLSTYDGEEHEVGEYFIYRTR